jgi:hypothetical protein
MTFNFYLTGLAPEDGTGVSQKTNEVYPVKLICPFCLTGVDLTGAAKNPISL